MNYLLDTQLDIWLTLDIGQTPTSVLVLLNDSKHGFFFSAASLCEVAIKFSQRRPSFNIAPTDLRNALLDRGLFMLPITDVHAVVLAALPPIHKDPFDRILIAQAIVEKYTLLTADSLIALYPGPIRKV